MSNQDIVYFNIVDEHSKDIEKDGSRYITEFELRNSFDLSPCFHRILEHMIQIGANRIKQNNSYTADSEWNDMWDKWYQHLFKKYPRTTIRLDFFKKNDTTQDFLGFCCIRPVSFCGVSTTYLLPEVDKRKKPKSFVLTLLNCKENIDGKDYEICSMPFIQQDSSVGSCAQAAVWMATKYMETTFGCKSATMHKITELATKEMRFNRRFPVSGLNEVQMISALDCLDYSPLSYSKESGNWQIPPEEIIYKYVESNIPAIVSTDHHTYVIVGHTFNPTYLPPLEPFNGKYYSSVMWIDNFVKHDDAAGPYLLLPTSNLVSTIENIIIPLPSGINMPGELAEVYSYDLLNRLPEFFEEKSDAKKMINQGLAEIGLFNKKLVMRTYLAESKKFKEKFEKLPTHSTAKDYYLSKDFECPRYVWITELSILNIFAYDRKMLGEIILDSTASSYFEGFPFLAIHLPGVIITNKNRLDSAESVGVIKVEKEHQYNHNIRR